MRHVPLFVHAVARESAADVIVDAPAFHLDQRIQNVVQGLLVFAHRSIMQKEIEVGGNGELGRPVVAAPFRIPVVFPLGNAVVK